MSMNVLLSPVWTVDFVWTQTVHSSVHVKMGSLVHAVNKVRFNLLTIDMNKFLLFYNYTKTISSQWGY